LEQIAEADDEDEARWQLLSEDDEAEGFTIGQLKGASESVEITVKALFPVLADLAHQKAASMTQLKALRALTVSIATASDEETARSLLLPQDPS
jgi:hypothetical protein